MERLERLNVIWEPEKLRRSQWDIKFHLLEKYLAGMGDILVPADYITPCGTKLGLWLSNQRSYLLAGSLSAARRQKLDSLGMVWRIHDDHWEQMYLLAQQYYAQYGHLTARSNRDQKMELPLRCWLVRQREEHRAGRLPAAKTYLLEQLAIHWEVAENQWQEAYEQAREYFAHHGHLLVPKDTGTPELRKLGRWISTQRRVYRKKDGALQGDRVKKLEAIGMIWDAAMNSDARWEEQFCKAEIFYRQNGHLEPSAGPLSTWVLAQKYKKKGNRGGLTPRQVCRLEAIGIIWDTADVQWMSMYQLACDYYHIHEKLNVPVHYTAENGERLGEWISRQRSAYKNLKQGLRGGGRPQISPQQVNLLNDIEMVWDASILSACTSFQERAIHYYLKPWFPDVCKLSRWEPLGYEIDVYLPSLKTGIEYDGHMHADKAAQDEKKNHACRENGIRILRVREPGLPLLSGCDGVVELEDEGDAAFEQGLCQLFQLLGLNAPTPQLAKDRHLIYAGYRDYVSYRWDTVYEQLWLYHQQHHSLPQTSDLKSKESTCFVSWLHVQRQAYQADELTELQIHKMEKLGFTWAPTQARWEYMYGCACAYHKEHGNLNPPASYITPVGEKLGSWLNLQRSSYCAQTLSAKRIRQLERLGVVWTPMRMKQNAIMTAAKDYYRAHGDLAIPSAYIDRNGFRLGEWLVRLRARYRMGTLPEETACLLRGMGVEWTPFVDRWEEMFHWAEVYHAQYGNIWIPSNYITPQGKRLGEWISTQRTKYHGKGGHSRLTAKQLEKLESLGMVWDPYTLKWMLKYQEAQRFFETHGHLKVPSGYITETGVKLGMWLTSQRQAMRGNPNFVMTEERKRLLEAIGMDWALQHPKPNARRRQPNCSIQPPVDCQNTVPVL